MEENRVKAGIEEKQVSIELCGEERENEKGCPECDLQTGHWYWCSHLKEIDMINKINIWFNYSKRTNISQNNIKRE